MNTTKNSGCLYQDASAGIPERVEDLLARMTIEEKAAQLLAVGGSGQEPLIDLAHGGKPAKGIEKLQHGIGHISKPDSDLSPRQGAEFNNAIQSYLRERTRLKIPAILHTEALHGHMAPGGTVFPQALALGSTWDPELIEAVFTAVAREVRARGCQQVLGPLFDLARDPRMGRVEEMYGEDPHLVARLGVACVRGLQGSSERVPDDRVAATAKHFAAIGEPRGGTWTGPADHGERTLRDVVLAPFRAAVCEARILSVMPSYNEIDGVYSHGNRWLLQTVLRQEWGFAGYVVSDYMGINDLMETTDGTPEAAGRKALETGVDVELPEGYCYKSIAGMVERGVISEAVLDAAVRRILRIKFLLGLFENPFVDPDRAELVTCCPEHRALARKTAEKAVILLQNRNALLPLDIGKIKTVAVIGPNAAQCHYGGYTSHQPPRSVSILEGLREKGAGKFEVLYSYGCQIVKPANPNQSWSVVDNIALTPMEVCLPRPDEDDGAIREAVALARRADVVVLAIGGNEHTCCEGWEARRGDAVDLDLPGNQNKLLDAVVATGKPVVAVLIGGRPLAIPHVAEKVPAIIEAWYLGIETGTAIADVLFGDVNPSGKLSVSFPLSAGHVPVYYNHKKKRARELYLFTRNAPLFPFGHGLSYTTFAYANLSVTPETIRSGGKAVVGVDVTNTGKRAGDEVVQFYLRDVHSSVTRPLKELKGFQRVALEPGQTRRVEFTVTPEMLAFHNENMESVVEPGAFELMVGTSSVATERVTLNIL